MSSRRLQMHATTRTWTTASAPSWTRRLASYWDCKYGGILLNNTGCFPNNSNNTRIVGKNKYYWNYGAIIQSPLLYFKCFTILGILLEAEQSEIEDKLFTAGAHEVCIVTVPLTYVMRTDCEGG